MATVRKFVFQDGKGLCERHGSGFDRVSPNIFCKLNDSPSELKVKRGKKLLKANIALSVEILLQMNMETSFQKLEQLRKLPKA